MSHELFYKRTCYVFWTWEHCSCIAVYGGSEISLSWSKYLNLRSEDFEGLKVRLVCLVCSARRLSSGLRQWQFARFNMFESVPENNSESEHVNVSAQTEGCLNVTWSFPIILKRECFHNNMSRLKWLKLSTLLIFKMVSKCCFVYVSYICVYLVYLCFGFSFWKTNIYYW